MTTQNSSSAGKSLGYDVAPAHDAATVEAAPERAAPEPQVSRAAVEEIQRNAAEAADRAVAVREPDVRAREPRGEEFDFDPLTQSIAPEAPGALKPGAKYGSAWLMLALALAYGAYTFGAVNGEKSRRPLPVGPFVAQSGAPVIVKVQVAGQVNKPGVYDLPFNARVQDAIRKAGGFKAGADKSALNLADWAQDGAKIDVPAHAALASAPAPTVTVKEVPLAAAPAISAPPNPSLEVGENAKNESAKSESGIPLAKTESGATSSNASSDYLRANPIDLNKATQAQLEVLPGIGPKMAERIAAYRAENGGFKSVDELDEVKGIGEKRMETLKPLVKVR